MNIEDDRRTPLDQDFGEPDDAALKAQEQCDSSQLVDSRALVVIVSDTEKHDGIDQLVTELLVEDGFTVDAVVRVPKKKSAIRKAIETAVVGGADLVLTVGGTGVGPRDKAPEATRSVMDKFLPGIGQALRFSGLACGSLEAGTSRGIAGVSGSTVIVNIADTRLAIRDGMATLRPLVHHVISQLQQW